MTKPSPRKNNDDYAQYFRFKHDSLGHRIYKCSCICGIEYIQERHQSGAERTYHPSQEPGAITLEILELLSKGSYGNTKSPNIWGEIDTTTANHLCRQWSDNTAYTIHTSKMKYDDAVVTWQIGKTTHDNV